MMNVLSSFTFNFNLRRYNLDIAGEEGEEVGRRRLTLSNPRWKRLDLNA